MYSGTVFIETRCI